MKKISLSQIPEISVDSQKPPIDLALRVKANGENAKVYISKREHLGFSGDDKIVIEWDSPNAQYGESFMTKYYSMSEPGILQFGYNNEHILLEDFE